MKQDEVIGDICTYHRPDCHILRNSRSNQLMRFQSWGGAVAEGMKPCGVCKPTYFPLKEEEVIGAIYTYHRPHCPLLRQIHPVDIERYQSWEKAEAQRKRPCDLCLPSLTLKKEPASLIEAPTSEPTPPITASIQVLTEEPTPPIIASIQVLTEEPTPPITASIQVLTEEPTPPIIASIQVLTEEPTPPIIASIQVLTEEGDMNNEDRATAYHEAGHALVGHRFGHYGDRITIVPEGNTVGKAIGEAEWADGSKDIEQIIALYAGFASESTYYENANKLGSSNDEEKAADLLQRTNETEANLRTKAKEIIDKNWMIIEAIAEKLFVYKTLEADEWAIIIDAFDEGYDWEEKFDEMRAIMKRERP